MSVPANAPPAPHRGFYARLASNVLFPLHERLKHHDTVAVRKALEQSQWWSGEALRALQLARLQALLQHAKQHVPYYRAMYDRMQFDPCDVTDLSDLRGLPLLTKAEIRANTNALKSDRALGLSRFNTGGSSGEPLVFFIGKQRISHDVAAKWRATRWWGVDIGDPEIVVWGSPIELGAQDGMRRLRDAAFRTRLLPAFEMSNDNLDAFVATIRRTRPLMLFGYPSALAHVARHAASRGVKMDDLGIRVAFVTSERLYDDQRDVIEGIFGCRVANGYGGRDAGFIAHACPQGGMHITAEDIIVEAIGADGKPVGNDETGEIVVTHLATADYPFIRYRTGDFGVLDSRTCSCGRGLPLIKEIQGRTTDFVVAADGTVMHGLAVVYPIRDLAGIEAFKVIQETRARIRVQIVPNAEYGPNVANSIISGLKARLGPTVEVMVERVTELPRERSGKFRYVQSLVTEDPHA